jgi:integrase
VLDRQLIESTLPENRDDAAEGDAMKDTCAIGDVDAPLPPALAGLLDRRSSRTGLERREIWNAHSGELTRDPGGARERLALRVERAGVAVGSGSSCRTYSLRRSRRHYRRAKTVTRGRPLFRGVGADRLRVAIARGCKAAGIPVFSPHELRHRRISLLHRQGRTWAEIGRLVGQRKLSLTADTYTHVLSDGRELDYPTLLAELIS